MSDKKNTPFWVCLLLTILGFAIVIGGILFVFWVWSINMLLGAILTISPFVLLISWAAWCSNTDDGTALITTTTTETTVEE